MRPPQPFNVMVVDLEPYWRSFAVDTLQSVGFVAWEQAGYDLEAYDVSKADLIVLGCAIVGSEERALITRLLAGNQAVVVLAVSLSWEEMRFLFRAGVRDVADKPYYPHDLISLINAVILPYADSIYPAHPPKEGEGR